jgi:hypothetical protein
LRIVLLLLAGCQAATLHPAAQLLLGDEVTLSAPPGSGGYEILAGAKVKDLDRAQIAVRLLDPESGLLLAFDQRSAAMIDGGDGWLETSEPNELPACPAWVDGDRVNRVFRIELTATDGANQAADSKLVTLRCPDDHCVCVCSAGYTFGKC